MLPVNGTRPEENVNDVTDGLKDSDQLHKLMTQLTQLKATVSRGTLYEKGHDLRF